MMYRIKTTRQATADRDHCFDYIAERSPDGALRWLEAYEMAVGSLLENPLRGRIQTPTVSEHRRAVAVRPRSRYPASEGIAAPRASRASEVG